MDGYGLINVVVPEVSAQNDGLKPMFKRNPPSVLAEFADESGYGNDSPITEIFRICSF